MPFLFADDVVLRDANSARRPMLFVDRLSFAACLRLVPLWRDSVVWCFEPPRRWLVLALGCLRSVGLGPAEIREVNCTAGDVRDAAGHGVWVAVVDRTRSICTRIRQDFLADPLLHRLGPDWPPDRLAFHLDRRIEEAIRREVTRISLAGWIRDRSDARVSATLAIKATPWLDYLSHDARAARLALVTYRDPGGLRWAWKTLGALGSIARSDRAGTRTPRPAFTPERTKARGGSTIAIKYGHRTLSLDPQARSDLFWLDGLERGDVTILLHGYPALASCPAALLRELAETGIRVTGPVGRAPVRESALAIWRVCKAAIRTPTRHVARRWEVLRGLIPFALEFARWTAFYRAQGVNLTVTTMMNGSVAETLAVEALGGLATSYQYSIANLAFPTAWLTAGEGVQFVHSRIFADLWRALGGPPARYVCTGALYERPPRVRDEPDALRASIMSAGARFVICFFDENSIDRWDIFPSHREAADEYAVLARWVLDDPTLAVIAKPKKPADLSRRIAAALPLVQEAELTGRWRFVSGDGVYPADVARSADVCLGRIGTTATLEAQFSGVRSVQIDMQSLRDHPFYAWGRGSVVFDSWTGLARALRDHRSDPASSSFGDWTAVLDEFDPYRDGQAARRMGLYILALSRALRDGVGARKAVERADAQLRRPR